MLNRTTNFSNSEDVTNSSSSNSTDGTDYELEFPNYIKNTATVLCVIILLLGITGNIMVPVVVCKTKELRNSTNIFLMNLSLADLLVLLVCVPPVLVELYTKPEVWTLGEAMCKIVPYIEMTAAHCSILTILAISFERYYAICQPLKASYTCTKVRALIIICTIWIVVIFVTSPVLFIADYTYSDYIDGSIVPVCLTAVQKPWKRIYIYLVISIFFLVPFFILLVVYSYIARHLMMDRSGLTSSSERIQMRARKQVVFMLIAVVLSFFFCLLPFRVFTIYIMLVSPQQLHSLGMEVYYCLLYFCRLMLYTNSTLNPILYNVISSKFRESFMRLLGCRQNFDLSSNQKYRTSLSGATRSSLKSGSTHSSQIASHVISL